MALRSTDETDWAGIYDKAAEKMASHPNNIDNNDKLDSVSTIVDEIYKDIDNTMNNEDNLDFIQRAGMDLINQIEQLRLQNEQIISENEKLQQENINLRNKIHKSTDELNWDWGRYLFKIDRESRVFF